MEDGGRRKEIFGKDLRPGLAIPVIRPDAVRLAGTDRRVDDLKLGRRSRWSGGLRRAAAHEHREQQRRQRSTVHPVPSTRMENRGYQNRLGKDPILTVFSSACEIGSAVRLSPNRAWSFTARDQLLLRVQLRELAGAPTACRNAQVAPLAGSPVGG